jgi:hypothetical protein
VINPTQGQDDRPPANAYPPSVFAAQEHITGDRVKTEIVGDHLYLWIGGLSISVNRHADDTTLKAAEEIGDLVAQHGGRFAAQIRALRTDREAHRVAEPTAAAHRAAEHHQAPPDQQHGHPHAEPTAGGTVVYPIAPA